MMRTRDCTGASPTGMELRCGARLRSFSAGTPAMRHRSFVIMDSSATTQEAFFGVLFTIQNEKPSENKVRSPLTLGGSGDSCAQTASDAPFPLASAAQFVVLLTFIVEWIQLLMFLLDPLWQWNINFRNVFWKWLARFQASPPPSAACSTKLEHASSHARTSRTELARVIPIAHVCAARERRDGDHL